MSLVLSSLMSSYCHYCTIISFCRIAVLMHCLHTIFETMGPFLKTLHTIPPNTHTKCKWSQTFCNYTLTLLKILFLHNSTHKNKIINHMLTKLHTDVNNVKHYSRVFFLFSVLWSGVCHSTHTCIYVHSHAVHTTVCMCIQYRCSL